MRIAHFTNTYRPVVSGVVRSISTFRQALTELGHVVFVFSQHASHHKDEEPFVFRYPAFELPVHNNFPVAIPVSPFVDRLLPPLKLDVIHAHHPFLLGQTAASKAEELNVPFVFTFHTRYRDYSHYISLNQVVVKEVIDRWLGVYMEQCQHVVVPSESIQRLLGELYGLHERVTVIPTGIDLKPYQSTDGAAMRRRRGWDDDRVLISVGRLAKEKNWGMLLTAVAEVLTTIPNVRLVILGEGEERKSLEKRARELGIAERVELPGTVPFDRVPDYLAAANLFCFASTSETQGLVTMEAMAAGLAVAAVDATGTSDVVTQGAEGLLTENDPQALAQAIIDLLQDDERRGQMEQAALRRAAEFDSLRLAERLIDVYQQAKEDKRAGRAVQLDEQKPLLNGKWYELLGLEKNPFRALQSER